MKRTVIMGILAYMGVPSPGIADSIPADLKNLFTLVESTHTDTQSLAIFYGDGRDHTLTGTGSYSENGWAWNVSETYLGLPLNLNYFGVLDAAANIDAWNGVGTYGGLSWHSGGTAQFLTDTSVNLTSTGFVGDPDTWSVSLSGTFTFGGSGRTTWTVFGSGEYDFDDGRSLRGKVKDSVTYSSITRPDYEKEGNVTADLSDDLIATLSAKGSTNDGKVTTTVTVSNEPEPATFALVGISIFPLLLLCRKRIRTSSL